MSMLHGWVVLLALGSVVTSCAAPQVPVAGGSVSTTPSTEAALSQAIQLMKDARENPDRRDAALRALYAASHSPEDWGRVVRELGVMQVRRRWPLGTPFRAWLSGPEWLSEWTIRARFIEPNLGEVRRRSLPFGDCGVDLEARERENGRIQMKPLPRGTTRVRIELSIDSEGWDGWSGQVEYPIQIVAKLDDAIPIEPEPRMLERLREGVCVVVERTGNSYVLVRVHRDDVTMGVALRCEVRRGQTAVESILLSTRPAWGPGSDVDGIKRLRTLLPMLTPEQADQEGWTLHLTGTNEGLLDSWEVERAWGGEFTMPLSEAMTRYEFPK